MLRLYVFLKSKPDRARDSSTSLSAARRAGSPRTTRLLLLVFFLSAFRKFRSLCELIAPFTPSATKSRLRAVAGSSDFTPYTSAWSGLLIPPRATGPYASNNISASRWLWTEKHAWAGVDPREDGAKAAMPPVSDDNSILLRQRLQGIEVTLSLLDTISDGVALFAKLGVTISLPFQLLHNRLLKRIAQTRAVFNQSKRTRGVFEKLSTRAELLADLFWLSGTLVSLAHSEWERREVWKYGRRVRRLMREEEVERDRAERELELQMSEYRTDENSVDDAAYAEGMDEEQRLLENERRIQRIRDQRRTLRDLRGRLTWLWWDRLRLGADAVFALYDLFEWRPGSEAVRAVAGAISAGVGFSQVRPIFNLVCSRRLTQLLAYRFGPNRQGTRHLLRDPDALRCQCSLPDGHSIVWYRREEHRR